MIPKNIKKLFGPIIESINDVVVITSADPARPAEQEVIYVNPAFTRLTGYSYDDAVGRSPDMLNGPETDKDTCGLIRTALEAQRPIEAEIQNYRKDGQPYWVDRNVIPLRDSSGETIYFASIEHDITPQKSLESRLNILAQTDELTHLRNRRAFMAAMEQEMARARRYHLPLCLMVLDLDFFKTINDRYGHAAGDAVLIGFAKTGSRLLRTTDVSGRIGGEEFAILMPETRRDGALTLAERLRNAVKQRRTRHHGNVLSVTVSIGVAEFIPPEKRVARLLERADLALYAAKNDGRDCVRASWETPQTQAILLPPYSTSMGATKTVPST